MANYFDLIGDAQYDALHRSKIETFDRKPQSIEQMLIEGRARNFYWRATNWAATQPAVTAGAANTLGPTVVGRPGKKIYITSIDVDLSGGGQVEGVFDADATNNWQSWIGVAGGVNLYGETRLWMSFPADGGTKTKKFTGFIMNENSVMNFQYRSNTTSGLNFSVEVHGIEVPNEPNMEAKFKIGVIGDSTAWGANLGNDTLGRAYLGRWQWSETFRDHCRANGVDAQIFFNDAEDGKTMMECAYRMLTGYTRIPVDLLFVSAGLNDAVDSKFPTEQRFKEAATYFITERNRWNPGKPIVFLLPNPTDDPTRTTNWGTIRTWITSIATGDDVYLVDQALAINMNASEYKEQSAGSFVHPNGFGSNKIGNYLWQQLKGPIFGIS